MNENPSKIWENIDLKKLGDWSQSTDVMEIENSGVLVCVTQNQAGYPPTASLTFVPNVRLETRDESDVPILVLDFPFIDQYGFSGPVGGGGPKGMPPESSREGLPPEVKQLFELLIKKKDQVPIQIGMLSAQWAAKRFGTDASELDPSTWSWASYAKGAAGALAAAMVANVIKPGMGQKILVEGEISLATMIDPPQNEEDND